MLINKLAKINDCIYTERCWLIFNNNATKVSFLTFTSGKNLLSHSMTSKCARRLHKGIWNPCGKSIHGLFAYGLL